MSNSDKSKNGPPKFTLLYVEDNPSNLALVESIIEMRGSIKLLSAPDAKLGLELARAHQLDLILMDIHLPGMNGISALQHLKACKETCTIPVVALSAAAMPMDIDRAMAEGFRYYLTKPIQVNRLLEVLDEFLQKKGG